MINDDPDNAEQAALAINSKFPGTINMNKVRGLIDNRQAQLEKERKIKQQNDNMAVTGDPAFSKLSVKDRQESTARVLTSQATQAIMNQRKQEVAIAHANGDTEVELDDNPPSNEEIQEWMSTNQDQYANFWAKHGTVTPQVQIAIRNLLGQTHNINITPEQAEAVKSGFENMNVLQDRDPILFGNHMSKSELDQYEGINYILKNTNAHPTEALETYRQFIKDGPYDDQEAGIAEDATNSIYDDLIDTKGNKWFGFFNKDVENEELTKSMINEHYREAYQKTGNHEMAVGIARATMFKNGSVIGNTFHPDAQKLQDKSFNGDYTGWLRGVNANAETMEILSRAGFPLDVDLTGDKVTHMMLPNGQVRLTTQDTNGAVRAVTLNLPNKESDMLDYGLSKALGEVNQFIQPLGRAIVDGVNNFDVTDVYKPTIDMSADVKASAQIKYGKAAIKAVEELEGELTPIQKRVIELEGFSYDQYDDSKGISTIGVGQTGEFKGKTFKETFKIHEDRVKRRIPKYDSFPEKVQAELMQAEYRGDLGLSPDTIKLLNAGKYTEASREFLDNDEYKTTSKSGIKARMKAVADAIATLT